MAITMMTARLDCFRSTAGRLWAAGCPAGLRARLYRSRFGKDKSETGRSRVRPVEATWGHPLIVRFSRRRCGPRLARHRCREPHPRHPCRTDTFVQCSENTTAGNRHLVPLVRTVGPFPPEFPRYPWRSAWALRSLSLSYATSIGTSLPQTDVELHYPLHRYGQHESFVRRHSPWGRAAQPDVVRDRAVTSAVNR